MARRTRSGAPSIRCFATFGRIDVLVNAPGGLDPQTAGGAAGRDGRRRGVSDDELRFIIDVNLTEALLCTRAVGPHMLERGSGKVINIGSWTAHQGGRDMVLYTTAKIALAGFSGRRRSNGRPTGCTSMRLRRAFSWTS